MNRKYGDIFAAAIRQSQIQPLFIHGRRVRLEVPEESRGDVTEGYGPYANLAGKRMLDSG